MVILIFLLYNKIKTWNLIKLKKNNSPFSLENKNIIELKYYSQFSFLYIINYK